MRLEDYFDFRSPTDIRLKGSDLGVEVVLGAYLDLALFAEEIALRFRSLTLEQVYATLTFYWRNKETMDAYLRQARETPGRLSAPEEVAVSPAVRRLREMAGKRDEQKRQATGT
jgi:uncharacterized protein (DUF433 family)